MARAHLEDLPGILAILRSCWAHMLQADPASTVWEKMACNDQPVAYPGVPPSQTSLAHTWAAGPTYALTAAVLGVRPLEPGYARAAVEPLLAPAGDALEWAEGTVPTPHGGIRVRWEKTGAHGCRLEVDVPLGVTADVRFPLADVRTSAADGMPAVPHRIDEAIHIRCLARASQRHVQGTGM